MIRRDSNDTADYYLIDLADFEEVPPPLPQPPDSLSIAEFGASPNDGSDDSAALQRAIDAARARGKVLWVPPGQYDIISSPLQTSGITIQGAGMWYSVFQGANAHFAVSGNNNQFDDFAVFGDVTFRDDRAPDDGFRGPAGTGSRMQNVWIEHVKAGWWVSYANARPTTPQTDGLVIRGVRIRNTFADGGELLQRHEQFRGRTVFVPQYGRRRRCHLESRRRGACRIGKRFSIQYGASTLAGELLCRVRRPESRHSR